MGHVRTVRIPDVGRKIRALWRHHKGLSIFLLAVLSYPLLWYAEAFGAPISPVRWVLCLAYFLMGGYVAYALTWWLDRRLSRHTDWGLWLRGLVSGSMVLLGIFLIVLGVGFISAAYGSPKLPVAAPVAVKSEGVFWLSLGLFSILFAGYFAFSYRRRSAPVLYYRRDKE